MGVSLFVDENIFGKLIISVNVIMNTRIEFIISYSSSILFDESIIRNAEKVSEQTNNKDSIIFVNIGFFFLVIILSP